MTNTILQDTLKADISKLVADSKTVSGLNHSVLRGTARELNFGSILKKYLPFHLDVGKGIIQDSFGNESAETDLLIYNRSALPPIIFGDQNEIGIFPFESVLYAFEIKSRSTATEIQSTSEKFRKLKELKPHSNIKHNIITAYFAYDSDLKDKTELERYMEIEPLVSRVVPPIHAICVLGKGYWYHGVTSHLDRLVNMFWQFVPPQNENYELAHFICGILNTIVPNIGIGYYLLPDDYCEYAFFVQNAPFRLEFNGPDLKLLNTLWNYYETEDDKNAIKTAKLFSFPQKSIGLVLFDLASKRYEEKKYTQSLEYLNEAVACNIDLLDNIEFLFMRSVAYCEGQDFSNALKDLNDLKLKKPDFIGLDYTYGTIYFKKKDFNNALSYYESSLETNPAYIDNYLMIARCYINLDQKKEARVILNKALLLKGDNKEIFSLLSYCD